jgi:hypothetical protein
MDTSNRSGQILVEICLVMALIITVGLAALSQINSQRHLQKKYQLSEERWRESKNDFNHKK